MMFKGVERLPHLVFRSLDWKFALPLKRGAQLKVECWCTAAELQAFSEAVALGEFVKSRWQTRSRANRPMVGSHVIGGG